MNTYTYNCKYGKRLDSGKCPKKTCKYGKRLDSGKCPKKTCKYGKRLDSGKCPNKKLIIKEEIKDESNETPKMQTIETKMVQFNKNDNKEKCLNKYNKMNVSIRIERIVNKIIKNNNIKKHIQTILTNDTNNSIKKLLYLSNLINKKKSETQQIEDRTFISNKLSKYILQNHYKKNMKIADIGGGNGQVLKEIGSFLKIPRENLFCVEQINPWSEPYSFYNSEFIQYVFWDNQNIPIEPLSLDIVLIMVTLHHMDDKTIQRTFENLNKQCKTGSLLIMKEHDCNTAEDKYIIDWEHHLYHLIETPIQTETDIIEYKKHYIDNYKTKKWFDNCIQKYGFISIMEFNRFFERSTDNKNPSNLYWKIYRKN